LADNSG